MSITTLSMFYYGHLIDENNYSLDFAEGVNNFTAFLKVGSYSAEEFVTEIARAMNEAGEYIYTSSFDRVTRKITISADNTFSLLPVTGSTKTISCFGLAGFTADLTGSNSYEGGQASGSVYYPQAVLNDYIDFEEMQSSQNASVNESGSGIFEIISFGDQREMNCTIDFITSNSAGRYSKFRENLNGKQDAITFLNYIRNKYTVEFMKDRNDPSSYVKCIYTKSKGDRSGTGFKLQPMKKIRKPDFYEFKNITFRELV